MPSIVVDSLHQGITTLKINRPEALNALTWEAMEAFAAAVEDLHRRDDAKVLIVHGEGPAFCSGGDLFELHQYSEFEDGVRLATIMGQALQRLEDLPFPTIAAIEGPALGGGAELALSCDLRVMADDASLGMMHVRLAISPAWGGGQRLMRLVGYSRALEWMTAARVLNADQALAHNIVNRVVPPASSYPAAVELAESIARHDPAAVRAIKRLLRAGLSQTATDAALAERTEFPALWAARPHLEASDRFVERKNHRVPEH
jgi:enoyl-CoA hydratase/carnithine racemase